MAPMKIQKILHSYEANQISITNSRMVSKTTTEHISDLPSNVIYGIMECLPLQAAAKMSLLSKKWRDAWLTLPYLVLDAHFFRDVLGRKRYDMLEFGSLVSNILLEHNGSILKFAIDIPPLKHEPNIYQWVSFLVRNGVTEFTLHNHYKSPLKLPFCLFSCANLAKLNLTNCIFRPPHSFNGFRSLMSLDLANVAFQGDSFEGFVASCPLLEKLSLQKWTGFDHLNINAPNLKYLTISGIFQSICLGGCHLSSVSIILKETMTNNCKYKTRELIKFLVGSCKFEKLCFGDYFLKFLAAGGIVEMLPVAFTHVKNLMLSTNCSGDELSCAIGIMESCPNVEELNISVTKTADVDKCDLLGDDLSFKFLHLREITVRLWSGLEAELKLIEFLLACSPVLETFSLEVNNRFYTSATSDLSKRLKRFHKASQKVMVMISNTSRDGDCVSDFDMIGYSDSESESDYHGEFVEGVW